MAKSDDHYEEAFKSIFMNYITVYLDEHGKKVKVRDDKDLEKLFKIYDESHSEATGKAKNFSSEFIEKLKDTKAWKNRIGGIAGHFGNVQTFKRNAQVTLQASAKKEDLRRMGVPSYRYPGGYARKGSYRRGETIIVTFRDINTGKFVGKKLIEEEE